MGKSDSRIRVKAPATKGNHKAALNGNANARHPAEVKKHQALGQSKPAAKPLAKPARRAEPAKAVSFCPRVIARPRTSRS